MDQKGPIQPSTPEALQDISEEQAPKTDVTEKAIPPLQEDKTKDLQEKSVNIEPEVIKEKPEEISSNEKKPEDNIQYHDNFDTESPVNTAAQASDLQDQINLIPE